MKWEKQNDFLYTSHFNGWSLSKEYINKWVYTCSNDGEVVKGSLKLIMKITSNVKQLNLDL